MEKKKYVSKLLYTCTVISGMMTVFFAFYPTIADAWNRYVASRLISDYKYQEGSSASYEEWFEKAYVYNQELLESGTNNFLEYAERMSGVSASAEDFSWEVTNPDSYYEEQLNVTGNGMMGYIEIPSISVSLPIYHYTSEEVLSKGVGHLYGSSLPTGGKGTHCVLTGHSAITTARLFTDLEKVKAGDVFTLHVLGQSMNYEVDQIEVVLPVELKSLSIDPENDYVTLITCTPYAVNTHRLLVRGHRTADDIETAETESTVSRVKEAVHFPVTIFVMTGIGVLLALLLIVRIWRK